MRIHSVYKFYTKYFGYNSTASKQQSRNYAISIAETSKILERVYELKNELPIKQYNEYMYSRKLTKNFLKNFVQLSYNYYEVPFVSIEYRNATISISKEELALGHKQIDISFQYLIDSERNKIVILNFGPSSNMAKEIEVLKGLLNNFSVDIPIPETTEEVVYWNLNDGQTSSQDYKRATTVSKSKLVDTLNNSF